ncbi:hypothetical protein Nepgr_007653 [Nepenthes gracilis]|uniref:FAS1 domain-containing protein n=1 Tax=Nepenthes gracilis TaxID=150966 RepID=A0AAD3S7G4_NEPGR|nr:hypothetical protein Nepgr_007653 [Nepenthes gracilis]
MERRHASASAAAAGRLVLLSSLLLLTTAANGHNITRILAKFPEFSTFNHYLTITHLAGEINSRETITVCAVDNAAMNTLLAKHLSISVIKNVLSLHILLDYFGAKKLHQITNGTALAATMYQATGSAPGSSGFVNITDMKGGKVAFGAEDAGNLDAAFVKSVKEIPYNISVIQISKILSSPDAEAPTPGPAEMNLTNIMSRHGCKFFADTLSGTEAEKTYMDNLDGGLTIFCPSDDAFKGFLGKYKNLTAEGKTSFLLYHGMPIYQSLIMLKSNNGLMNTLATDGAKKYAITVQNDGEQVTLETKINTAKITGTIIDQQPLAIYTIDEALLPKELYKAGLSPAPAPAPEAKGKKSSKKHHHGSPPAPDTSDSGPSPADSPDDDVADQEADSNDGGSRFESGRLVSVVIGLWLASSLL